MSKVDLNFINRYISFHKYIIVSALQDSILVAPLRFLIIIQKQKMRFIRPSLWCLVVGLYIIHYSPTPKGLFLKIQSFKRYLLTFSEKCILVLLIFFKYYNLAKRATFLFVQTKGCSNA